MSVAAASYPAQPPMVAPQPKVVTPAQFVDALKKLTIPASQVILGKDQTIRVNNSLVVPEGHICTKQLHPLDIQRKVVVIAMPVLDFKLIFDCYTAEQRCPGIIINGAKEYNAIKAEEAAKVAAANAKIAEGNAKIAKGNAKIAEGNAKIATGTAMVAAADQQLTANALKRHQLLQQLALIKQQKLQVPPTAAAH